ncbi:hypothetical protein NUM3379_41180 [Kineococcus sp. NUM-3379]
MASHRVLALAFGSHVPEDLRARIRGARWDVMIGAIGSPVQALPPTQSPPASRIAIRADWPYRWSERSDVIPLAARPKNTASSDGVKLDAIEAEGLKL